MEYLYANENIDLLQDISLLGAKTTSTPIDLVVNLQVKKKRLTDPC